MDLQRLVDSDSGRQSWQALEVSLEKYWAGTSWNDQWRRTGSQFGLWQTPETKIAGVSFLAPTVNGRIRAVVLTAEVPEAVIPIHQVLSLIHISVQDGKSTIRSWCVRSTPMREACPRVGDGWTSLSPM